MDTIAATIAEAIAANLDYDALADAICRRMKTTTNTPTTDDNTPIPVAEIRRQLGRRGRPLSHTTFVKNYIDTGLLSYIDGPSRADKYVRRADWHRLIAQASQATQKHSKGK